MIIWGSRGITSTIDRGAFNCPQCSSEQRYVLQQVRNFFTLYFIPLIPLNVHGKYIECATCRGSFPEEVLDYDPEKDRQDMQLKMLRVMIMAALADGIVDDAERNAIRSQYMELAGLPVAPETLEKEIQLGESADADLNSYVGMIAGDLSDHGIALVVKLVFVTMSAHGEMQPGHQEQLKRLAKTLKIPDDQFVELLRHIRESTEDAGPTDGEQA